LIATVRPARKLEGAIAVPGDKSISHRALMLGSIAQGVSNLRGLSQGEDVQSTAACMRDLGVGIDGSRILGTGLRGLRQSRRPLDCGNSGTTMRLLAGLLAGQDFESELAGDESLSRRPMDRVVDPLREMGARASWPPLRVGGGDGLHGIEFQDIIQACDVQYNEVSVKVRYDTQRFWEIGVHRTVMIVGNARALAGFDFLEKGEYKARFNEVNLYRHGESLSALRTRYVADKDNPIWEAKAAARKFREREEMEVDSGSGSGSGSQSETDNKH